MYVLLLQLLLCVFVCVTFPLLQVQGSLGLVFAFFTAGSFFLPPPIALKLFPSTYAWKAWADTSLLTIGLSLLAWGSVPARKVAWQLSQMSWSLHLTHL